MAKRIGIVKVSLPVLEVIFGQSCKVDRVIVTDEDLIENTVSLIVSEHDSLPLVEPGHRLQYVKCTLKRDETGTVSVLSFDPY
jgi:hypothetical protein